MKLEISGDRQTETTPTHNELQSPTEFRRELKLGQIHDNKSTDSGSLIRDRASHLLTHFWARFCSSVFLVETLAIGEDGVHTLASWASLYTVFLNNKCINEM